MNLRSIQCQTFDTRCERNRVGTSFTSVIIESQFTKIISFAEDYEFLFTSVFGILSNTYVTSADYVKFLPFLALPQYFRSSREEFLERNIIITFLYIILLIERFSSDKIIIFNFILTYYSYEVRYLREHMIFRFGKLLENGNALEKTDIAFQLLLGCSHHYSEKYRSV